MSANSRRLSALIIAMLCVGMLLAGCGLVRLLAERRALPTPVTALLAPTVAAQTRPAAVILPTATHVPTAAPTLAPPTLAPPTLAPTATLMPTLAPPTAALPTAIPTLGVQSLTDFVLPSDSNQVFTLRDTDAALTDYARSQQFDLEGLEVRDLRLTFGTDEITADLKAIYPDANLSTGLRLRGRPEVHEGQIYLRVQEVTLDDTLSGLMRVIAQGVIERAIDQYSGENGIPLLPIEGVEVLSVAVQPGQITIQGRSR